MSPLRIEILLHYYAHCDDFRDGDFTAPAVREAINDFKASDMLSVDAARDGATYGITPRARYFIDFICALPLPEPSWTMHFEVAA